MGLALPSGLVAALALLGCGQSPSAPAKQPTPAVEVTVEPASQKPMRAVSPNSARTIDVDIPMAADLDGQRAFLGVMIAAGGELFVDGKRVADLAELQAAAAHFAARASDGRAVLMADKNVVYGRIIGVMDALKQGGVTKIAFAVQSSGPALSAPPPLPAPRPTP